MISELPKRSFRVLVTGGRDYRNRQTVYDVLDELHQQQPISCIIHGGADGADSMADGWALSRGVVVIRIPVEPSDWRAFGRRAGCMRNQKMLDNQKPDLIVAFPGGNGTKDMKRRAKSAGVRIINASQMELW